MKSITINLPEKYLIGIQLLIDSGKYPSKSEFVRKSIKESLKLDFNLSENLENANLNQMNMEGKWIENSIC